MLSVLLFSCFALQTPEASVPAAAPEVAQTQPAVAVTKDEREEPSWPRLLRMAGVGAAGMLFALPVLGLSVASSALLVSSGLGLLYDISQGRDINASFCTGIPPVEGPWHAHTLAAGMLGGLATLGLTGLIAGGYMIALVVVR